MPAVVDDPVDEVSDGLALVVRQDYGHRLVRREEGVRSERLAHQLAVVDDLDAAVDRLAPGL
jgi:hypothetical protein